MEDMYILLNNKDQSFYHFVKFFDYMIERSKFSFNDRQFEEDYYYHYYKLPHYLRKQLEGIRHDTLTDLGSMSIVTSRMSDKINKLTKLSDE